jgi:chemotaxis-related protein WspB
MLFLLFQLGENRYALDARQVAEVLPLVQITELPQAPFGVAGVFNYRGAPVPVMDLSRLAFDRPARRHLSTRIILVHYPDDGVRKHLLGLIAEKATETVRREPADFVPSGISNDAASYLGPVAMDKRGLVQRIEVIKLLPVSIRQLLFNEREL